MHAYTQRSGKNFSRSIFVVVLYRSLSFLSIDMIHFLFLQTTIVDGTYFIVKCRKIQINSLLFTFSIGRFVLWFLMDLTLKSYLYDWLWLSSCEHWGFCHDYLANQLRTCIILMKNLFVNNRTFFGGKWRTIFSSTQNGTFTFSYMPCYSKKAHIWEKIYHKSELIFTYLIEGLTSVVSQRKTRFSIGN